MANPIQLLPHGGRIPVSRTAMLAQVSRSQPLPVAFTDPLYVVLDYDPDHAIEVVNWPALHGATLPAAGADVLLVEDDQHGVRVAWWDGAHTDAALSGTVGGDLSGTLPNPTVATVLGGEVPITTVSARLTGADWITASLINGWANYGGAFETAAYVRDAFGFVHLKGTIKGGVIGSAAFALPAGYRPGALAYYLVPGDGATGAEVQILTNGSVNVYDQTADVSFSGITFLAEN